MSTGIRVKRDLLKYYSCKSYKRSSYGKLCFRGKSSLFLKKSNHYTNDQKCYKDIEWAVYAIKTISLNLTMYVF